MTVDPVAIQALAKLLCAATEDLPLDMEAEVLDIEVEELQDILDEIRVADLVPAVRAAAYRLAAREAAAGRG